MVADVDAVTLTASAATRAASAAFCEISRIDARLIAAGQPVGVTVRLEASADQLEAAVRETRRALDTFEPMWTGAVVT
jgi:hypothetical protein